jgi:anti-anti-sigma factor
VPADPLSKDYAPFHIDVHPERDVVRVVPVGELDLATAPELEAQLHELRTSGFERLVLDLRQLRFVDSSGIRVIVTEDQHAGAHDRGFSLIGGPPAVQRALELCGLLEHLHVEPADG